MTTVKKELLCPICKKLAADKFKPFCSFRCKQVDLFNWLNEGYKIPTDEHNNNNKDEE